MAENSSVSHVRLAALFLLHSTNTKMRILQYFISRTTFLHSFNIPGAISQDAITLVIRVKSAVQTAYNFLRVASYLFYEISTQRWETPHVIQFSCYLSFLFFRLVHGSLDFHLRLSTEQDNHSCAKPVQMPLHGRVQYYYSMLPVTTPATNSLNVAYLLYIKIKQVLW